MPKVQDREYRTMLQPMAIPTAATEKRFDTDFYVEGFATTFNSPYELYEWDGVKYYEMIARDALVGADMEGIARELEEDTGIPALGFSTTGFDYYDKGISDTAIKLIKRFSKKRETYKNSRTINVLGLTPLDFGADGNAEAIVRTLNEWGFTVNADLFFHTSMEELEHISNAGISVAVSAAGVKPAKYLAAEYGIPWTSGIPARWNLPLKERLEWLDDDRTNNAAVKATAVRTAIAPEGHGNILVVADQIAANAVREHLEYLIDADITCATFFTLHKELARPCDFRIGSENELVGIIESGKYRAVCGDPVLKEIPGVKELTFLDIPHPAVSSRLNWNDMPVIGSHELEETYYEFVRKLL